MIIHPKFSNHRYLNVEKEGNTIILLLDLFTVVHHVRKIESKISLIT